MGYPVRSGTQARLRGPLRKREPEIWIIRGRLQEEIMAYDEGLAQRVREEMGELPGYVEKKMFGGIGFMLLGNMACGVIGEDLIVRVGLERYADALAEPHTKLFDMTGRPMRGWVVVTENGYRSDEALAKWVGQGVSYALSLPAK